MSSDSKPAGALTVGVVLGGLVPGLVAWAAFFVVLSTARLRFWRDVSGYLSLGIGLLLTLLLPVAAAVVLRFRRVPSVLDLISLVRCHDSNYKVSYLS